MHDDTVAARTNGTVAHCDNRRRSHSRSKSSPSAASFLRAVSPSAADFLSDDSDLSSATSSFRHADGDKASASATYAFLDDADGDKVPTSAVSAFLDDADEESSPSPLDWLMSDDEDGGGGNNAAGRDDVMRSDASAALQRFSSMNGPRASESESTSRVSARRTPVSRPRKPSRMLSAVKRGRDTPLKHRRAPPSSVLRKQRQASLRPSPPSSRPITSFSKKSRNISPTARRRSLRGVGNVSSTPSRANRRPRSVGPSTVSSPYRSNCRSSPSHPRAGPRSLDEMTDSPSKDAVLQGKLFDSPGAPASSSSSSATKKPEHRRTKSAALSISGASYQPLLGFSPNSNLSPAHFPRPDAPHGSGFKRPACPSLFLSDNPTASPTPGSSSHTRSASGLPPRPPPPSEGARARPRERAKPSLAGFNCAPSLPRASSMPSSCRKAVPNTPFTARKSRQRFHRTDVKAAPLFKDFDAAGDREATSSIRMSLSMDDESPTKAHISSSKESECASPIQQKGGSPSVYSSRVFQSFLGSAIDQQRVSSEVSQEVQPSKLNKLYGGSKSVPSSPMISSSPSKDDGCRADLPALTDNSREESRPDSNRPQAIKMPTPVQRFHARQKHTPGTGISPVHKKARVAGPGDEASLSTFTFSSQASSPSGQDNAWMVDSRSPSLSRKAESRIVSSPSDVVMQTTPIKTKPDIESMNDDALSSPAAPATPDFRDRSHSHSASLTRGSPFEPRHITPDSKGRRTRHSFSSSNRSDVPLLTPRKTSDSKSKGARTRARRRTKSSVPTDVLHDMAGLSMSVSSSATHSTPVQSTRTAGGRTLQAASRHQRPRFKTPLVRTPLQPLRPLRTMMTAPKTELPKFVHDTKTLSAEEVNDQMSAARTVPIGHHKRRNRRCSLRGGGGEGGGGHHRRANSSSDTNSMLPKCHSPTSRLDFDASLSSGDGGDEARDETEKDALAEEFVSALDPPALTQDDFPRSAFAKHVRNFKTGGFLWGTKPSECMPKELRPEVAPWDTPDDRCPTDGPPATPCDPRARGDRAVPSPTPLTTFPPMRAANALADSPSNTGKLLAEGGPHIPASFRSGSVTSYASMSSRSSTSSSSSLMLRSPPAPAHKLSLCSPGTNTANGCSMFRSPRASTHQSPAATPPAHQLRLSLNAPQIARLRPGDAPTTPTGPTPIRSAAAGDAEEGGDAVPKCAEWTPKSVQEFYAGKFMLPRKSVEMTFAPDAPLTASVSENLDKVWREHRPLLEPDTAAAEDTTSTAEDTTSAAEDTTTAAGEPFPRMSCRLEDFDVLDVLGKGSFGTVSRVRHHATGEEFALKRTVDRISTIRQWRASVYELLALRRIGKHDYIVEVLAAWQEDGFIYYLMPVYDGAFCAWPPEEMTKGKSAEECFALLEPYIWIFLINMGSALQHVHDAGMLHMDFKPQNVLFRKEKEGGYRFYLTDFGQVRGMDGVYFQDPGDEKYRPAENSWGAFAQCDESVFTRSYDVWCLGKSAFEMMIGTLIPMRAWNLRNTLFSNAYLDQTGWSPELKALVLRMLADRPKDRPAALEVMQTASDWLDDYQKTPFAAMLDE